jgi:hypothetical protein
MSAGDMRAGIKLNHQGAAMNQDPERIHDAYAPVHVFPLVAGRCAEVLTDSQGCSRCHRADHGGEGEHHVNGRAWTGRQAAGTVRIRFGVACGPDCIYPDGVEAAGTLTGRTRVNRNRPASAAPG